MKNTLFLLGSFFLVAICNAQWVQVGQELFGEHSGDLTGSSVSINGDGNRVVIFDAFVESDTRGRARVFEFQGNNWIQLGGGIPGVSSLTGESEGMVKLNGAGDRLIFSSSNCMLNGVEYIGSTRVFEYQQGNWVQLGQTLYGENEGEFFGKSIDINSDGNKIIVGAPTVPFNNSPGYIKMYELLNGDWVQLGSKILGEANDDHFGTSVSINSDGNRIAAASPNHNGNGIGAGQVRIFQYENNSWNQIGDDILGAEGDGMGATFLGTSALSFNANGSILAIGNPGYEGAGVNLGRVKVFQLQNNNWVQKGQNINGEFDNGQFGTTLGLNEAGNILIIGSTFGNTTGYIKTYRIENNTWIQKGETLFGESNEWYGHCVDINFAGDRIIVGAFSNDGNGVDSGKAEVLQNDSILGLPNVAENTITIFPNPTEAILNITHQEEIEKITIYSLQGSIVYEGSSSTINVSHLHSGVYFVQATINGINITKAFVKN